MSRSQIGRLSRVVVLAFVVAGCSAGATASPSTSVPSPAGPSEGASSVPSAGPSATVAPLGAVRLALDWTPNTNHTGFYVAQANGWYEAAGVDLKILPYGSTTPEALMTAGQAECGISFQDSLTFAVASGAPITSVMAILQHTAQEIAVLDSSSITRPRQLDGKTYAGFGYPNEEPTLKSVIKADGGKGTFTSVTLDTAAYEALYNKRADFVITFAAWEGLEAAERGIKLRTFQFGDYGFPDFYQVILACDSRWLAAHPDLARAFVGATVRGFEVAADDPDGARRAAGLAEPGRLRRLAGPARRQPGVPREGRLPARRERRGRPPDPRRMDGLLQLPVRPGPAGRAGRIAARDRAGLRRAVHERLHPVTERPGRRRPLGTAARSWSGRSSSSGRPTSGLPGSIRSRCRRRRGSSRRCGSSGLRRSAISSRRSSRRSPGVPSRSSSRP